MSATHVLDASAVLKMVLDEPHAVDFRIWYGSRLEAADRFIAPTLLPFELANGLWRSVPPEHRPPGSWTRDLVRDLLVAVELDPDAWARMDPWCDRLSAYDAAYVFLAAAHGADLVTYDAQLAAIAREEVAVVMPGVDG